MPGKKKEVSATKAIKRLSIPELRALRKIKPEALKSLIDTVYKLKQEFQTIQKKYNNL